MRFNPNASMRCRGCESADCECACFHNCINISTGKDPLTLPLADNIIVTDTKYSIGKVIDGGGGGDERINIQEHKSHGFGFMIFVVILIILFVANLFKHSYRESRVSSQYPYLL